MEGNSNILVGVNTAEDIESLMIIELRRIFFFDESHSRDSNSLQELKIRLRPYIPSPLRQNGIEFQQIYDYLCDVSKITLGNYTFLSDILGVIDTSAVGIIAEYQDLIQIKLENPLQPTTKSKGTEVQIPTKDTLQKIFRLEDIGHDVVTRHCSDFKAGLEQKYLEKEYFKEAQVAKHN